jgi:hypothetical protein
MKELVALAQAVVNEEFSLLLDEYGAGDDRKCVICGATADMAWDYFPDGGRYADLEFCSVPHRDDCFVGMARAVLSAHEARKEEE